MPAWPADAAHSRSTFSSTLNYAAQPFRKIFFGYSSRSKIFHHPDPCCRCRTEILTIQPEERKARNERRPLVAVDNSMRLTADGFEWQGQPYKSLSAIARAITGTRWNGWVFFGLKNHRGRT